MKRSFPVRRSAIHRSANVLWMPPRHGGLAARGAGASFGAGTTVDAPIGDNVYSIDKTKSQVGLGLALAGTAAFAYGVLVSPILAVAGGVAAVGGLALVMTSIDKKDT